MILPTITILVWSSALGYGVFKSWIEPAIRQRQKEERDWWEEVLNSVPAEDEESPDWRVLNEKSPVNERRSKRHQQNRVLLESLAAGLASPTSILSLSLEQVRKKKHQLKKSQIKRVFEAGFKAWFKKYDPTSGSMFVQVDDQIYPIADIFPNTMELAYYPMKGTKRGNLRAVSYYDPSTKLILPINILQDLKGYVEEEAGQRFKLNINHFPVANTG